ncbi:MAG: hypothetical protein RLZZ292_85 [Bacteroidota bacterium]|jgi:hypothetical protein
MKPFLTVFALFVSVSFLFAQNNKEKYQYSIQKSSSKITLDGNLEETAWKTAQSVGQFFLNRPSDTTFAKQQTEVRMTFDDNFLYIGAVCYQDRKTYRTASLKRDFEGGTSDVFTANIDTYSDKLNAFHFAVTPFNVQREGLIDNSENISLFWDNKWYSQVTNFDDKWVAEIAIPFKTLRYKVTAGQNAWRINFGRLVLETNEISTWSPVPRNFHPANTAFNAKLVWAENPPKPSNNIALIPYMTSRYTEDFPRNSNDLTALPKVTDFKKLVIGGDAKIAVTSALNLDLTINPDFSQVEVDKQVANLSRFELFFPERRQFFLENNDLFDRWGFPITRPFFSRRIGIGYDPVKQQFAQVPILAGARLSGKLDNKTRIGIVNMQTKQVDFGNDKILPSANYSVATIQRNVLKRSILGGVFVNKQNFLSPLTKGQRTGFQPFNRVAGLEFNYNSADGRWEGESYYHHSFTPEKNAGTFAQFIGYRVPTFGVRAGYWQVSKDYQAEVGFVPRRSYQSLFTGMDFTHFTSDKILPALNSIGVGYDNNFTLNLAGKITDADFRIGPSLKFDDNSEAFANFSYNYTYLFEGFDPTNAYLSPNPDLRKNVLDLPVGDYKYFRWGVGYASSQRNNLSGYFDFTQGQYFNGKSLTFESNVGYRFQPYGSINLSCNFYDIKLPSPFNSTRYWLVGPRTELAFSRSVFASAFLQFNTQTNNMNLNARVQWRFRPVSDLFIVYTDNYFAQNIPNYQINAFSVKNRALVLKLTYWLNV